MADVTVYGATAGGVCAAVAAARARAADRTGFDNANVRPGGISLPATMALLGLGWGQWSQRVADHAKHTRLPAK